MIIYVLQYIVYSVLQPKVNVIRSKNNEIKWNAKKPHTRD